MSTDTLGRSPDTGWIQRTGRPERAVRRLLVDALGSGNLTVVDNFLTEDYAGRVDGMPDLPAGPAGFKRFVARLRRAVFALDVDLTGIETRRGSVVVHWTAHGRLERPFLGMEPACVIGRARREPRGPSATLSAVTVARLEQSKVRESHTRWTSIRRHPN